MKQQLELSWIGKEEGPRLEPRVLLVGPSLSCPATERVSENNIFEDNLLAPKAPEQEVSGVLA